MQGCGRCALSDAPCHRIGCCPGGLEVETASDAVDVEDFACEIEVGHMTAFEGGEVDGLQGHSATGDELILEGGTTGYLENIILQDVYQSVNVFFI